MISVIRKQNPQNYWYTLVLGSVNKWLPTLYDIMFIWNLTSLPIFEYEFIFEINETLFNDNHSVIKWRKVKSAWQKSAYFFYWPSNNVLVFWDEKWAITLHRTYLPSPYWYGVILIVNFFWLEWRWIKYFRCWNPIANCQ